MQKPRFGGAFCYIDADALYAFKSRGFGGEIGVMAPALTAEISCAYHNMVFPG